MRRRRGALERARRLLVRSRRARGRRRTPTALGRRLLAIPVAPRLARMLCEAEDLGVPADGALVAALASERDILRAARAFGGGGDRAVLPTGPSDLLVRAELFAEAARARLRAPTPASASGSTRTPSARSSGRAASCCVATGRSGRGRAVRASCCGPCWPGFPDRVCRRREPGSARAVMVGGTGVALAAESVVRDAELFVAVDVEGGDRGTEARVRLASAIERAWLAATFPGRGDDDADASTSTRQASASSRAPSVRYHDLVLDEQVRAAAPDEVAALLAEAAAAIPRARSAPARTSTRSRRACASSRAPCRSSALPDPDALVRGRRRRARRPAPARSPTLRRADVGGAMLGLLVARAARRRSTRDAPSHWTLPSGRRVPVVYAPERPPAVAARIQELFGLAASPRLGGGRVPLVIELLAPNQRPMQVTDDLASFWRTTYVQVRAELRGRYPKHPWPDDPLRAEPTARAKRRRSG